MTNNVNNNLYKTKTGMVVDPTRIAYFGEKWLFPPLNIKTTQPLAKALADNKIKEDTRVVVMELYNDPPLVFDIFQLAYHHVAQGVLRNRPWLVSF